MIQKTFERSNAEEIIVRYKDKPVIKVLQGIRRAGKSFMLELLAQKMRQSGIENERIVVINFEDFENVALLDIHALYDYIKQKSEVCGGKKLYLLFDEVQEAAGWEKCVNSLYASKTIDTDIYLTGSNARFLSSELATLLSGRYVTIHIQPLSYREFLYFNGMTDSAASFRRFLTVGGFPGLKDMMDNDVQIHAYLEGIYATVLLKDVIAHNKIRDTDMLSRIIQYAADNVGNIFTAKRIADFMKASGRSLSVETIYNDLQYLQDAFILQKVQRYDIRGRKVLETLEKYYFADHGLLFLLHGYKDTYINGILENIVYVELLRREYTVKIGKLLDGEIDFVAERGDERLYVQVTYLISSEETKEREYRSLRAINDNFPKLILSMDDLPPSNDEGILRKNIRDWLLEG